MRLRNEDGRITAFDLVLGLVMLLLLFGISLLIAL